MNIPLFKVFMSEDVLEPLNKLLMSGQLTQGEKVEDFDQHEIAKRLLKEWG